MFSAAIVRLIFLILSILKQSIILLFYSLVGQGLQHAWKLGASPREQNVQKNALQVPNVGWVYRGCVFVLGIGASVVLCCVLFN